MTIRHAITVAFVAIWLAVGAGCTPSSIDTPIAPTATPSPQITVSPTPRVIGECVWSAKLLAWLDLNGDGKHDNNEPPMPGVQFFFKRAGASDSNALGPFTADYHGEAIASMSNPGCVGVDYVVFPKVPAGYQLSTAERASASRRSTDGPFEFGFAYVPGAPTATPFPTAACTVYRLIPSSLGRAVSDIAVAHDNTIWVATSGFGVARLRPGDNRWTFFTANDGLASDDVTQVLVANDGTVWFATTRGVLRFDGSNWQTYTNENGLLSPFVYGISQSKDGTLWFASYGGISRYQPSINQWTTFTTRDGLAEEGVRRIAGAPDGSLWIAYLTKGLAHLTPASAPGEQNVWKTYSKLKIAGTWMEPFALVSDIQFDANGATWIAVADGLLRYDPVFENWQLADKQTLQRPYRTDALSARSFRQAPDGSWWVGTNLHPPQIYHYIPGHLDRDDIFWAFGQTDGLPVTDRSDTDRVNGIAVQSNDVIWIATNDAATRCDFGKR
ncbi:MAG: hypothetical protein HZB53_04640 [Chloroflexi bacterium]|nr:hypothetical protein [Chloroflexota bacterium]